MALPSYVYPCDHLHTGSSLGNRRAFARLDRVTALQGLWCSLDNQYYVGSWSVEIECGGAVLEPRTTTFFPEGQATTWSNGAVEADAFFFLPILDGLTDRLQSAHVLLTLRNRQEVAATVVIRQTVVFPGVVSSLFTKQPPRDQLEKRVHVVHRGDRWHVTTAGNASEARVFGSSLAAGVWASDSRALKASSRMVLEPGASRDEHLYLAFSPDGIGAAEAIFEACSDGALLLGESRGTLSAMLSVSSLQTPDAQINRAFSWAKVNTLRVQHQYRSGYAFTNDPPQDIVVIRDLAWYVLGADYLTPGFCSDMIAFAERFGYHEGGKLTEYLHANEQVPVQHDYHLNINDDTPLFVLALWHHALVRGGDEALAQLYPLMKRAADWILSQRRNGLVYAQGAGMGVWGICSWRNIIDNYNLTGAVTEINAECFYALLLTSRAALLAGRDREAQFYRAQAEDLRNALQQRLVSDRTGTYVLTVRNDGTVDHDITGDLVFPLMFDAAEGEAGKRALDHLLSSSFWTPFGVRTVHPGEPSYDPDFGYQLVGGVWPNLTAWLAYAARHERPDIVAEAMRNVYRQSEAERPADYVNVVPGEFPERLHGETFVSRGMAMSPWMPATYLWLGVEGLLGFTPEPRGATLRPALPLAWRWAAMKNLPFQQEKISFFVYDGTMYVSSRLLECAMPTRYGAELNTVVSDDRAMAIALQIGEEVALFVASDAEVDGTVVVELPSGWKRLSVRVGAGKARLFVFDLETLQMKGGQ